MPKGRSYSISRILSLRNQLLRSPALTDRLNKIITSKEWCNLVDIFDVEFQQRVPYSVLQESLQHLCNTKLTAELLKQTAWRLAGNFKKLTAGTAVYPWKFQKYDEWVPVQVISVYPEKKFDKFVYKLSCRILAGSPCPLISPVFWDWRRCSFRSQLFGFSKPWGKMPFQHPVELTNCRMTMLVSAAKSGDKPYLDKGCENESTSIVAYNKKLLKCRARLGGFVCPENFSHACFSCPIGYDRCIAGTHPDTYITRFCDICRRDSLFDPAYSLKFCVSCGQRQFSKSTAGDSNVVCASKI